MKKFIFFILFFTILSTVAISQNNINFLENLVDKTVEELDSIIFKKGWKIYESHYFRPNDDTSLIGIEAEWRNALGESIILSRFMMYVPLIDPKDSVVIGKGKVLERKIKLVIRAGENSLKILSSLITRKFTKKKFVPLDDGFEVKYENGDYDLNYEKRASKNPKVMIVAFSLVPKKKIIGSTKMYKL